MYNILLKDIIKERLKMADALLDRIPSSNSGSVKIEIKISGIDSEVTDERKATSSKIDIE